MFGIKPKPVFFKFRFGRPPVWQPPPPPGAPRYFVLLLKAFYRVFNLKVESILMRVIYLLRFTTYYIIQLTFIYSKCWK
jgi:hypothetical protein